MDATDLPAAASWQGERLAFTGRLGSLTRAQALHLLLQRGGQYCTHVGRATTVLVVGSSGLPLNPKGRLTRKLQRARALQQQRHPIQILDENEFLQRSGLAAGQSAQQRFALADVERMTSASRDRIRHLIQSGLIAPAEWREGIPLFDFGDIRLLRDILSFVDHGIRLATMRRSLQYLQHLLPGTITSRTALAALEAWGRRVVVRGPDGGLRETSGQRLLDFDDQPSTPTLVMPRDRYTEALQCEAAHDLEGAVRAYEALLLHDGPDADICFQLANVYYALERLEAAGQRFRQAVELEPDFCEAWNNLGNVLAQLGRHAAAVEAYQCALELDPDWCDARYGLADVLDEMGQATDAAQHWQLLLASRPDPEYARYARQRLATS